jgi:hypothetical protein
LFDLGSKLDQALFQPAGIGQIKLDFQLLVFRGMVGC